MVLKCFSVYDTKVQAYARPFFMQTTGAAIRSWIDICNDDKAEFTKHPEDYTLFEIGEFDDANGQLSKLSTPVSLGTALEHRRPNPFPSPEAHLSRTASDRINSIG